MSKKTIKITRKELYDKVWLIPMIKLSQEYNLSDNGLRKICYKANIPMPARGYWASKQNGYGSASEKLNGDFYQEVLIHVKEKLSPRSHNKKSLVEMPIVVPEKLTKPHSYIAKEFSKNKIHD